MDSFDVLWVVVVPDDEISRVQDLGYWRREDAERRAKHLNHSENVASRVTVKNAEVWPVRFYEPKYHERGFTGSMMATIGKGLELNAYDAPERKFSMVSVAQSAVDALVARKGADNLTEADLTALGIPPGLFEEHGGQLRLFPRELP